MGRHSGVKNAGMVLGIKSRTGNRRDDEQATAGWLRSENAGQNRSEVQAEPPLPGSPTQIPASGWRATTKRTLAEVKKDNVTMVSGSLAYNAFMSVFPPSSR